MESFGSVGFGEFDFNVRYDRAVSACGPAVTESSGAIHPLVSLPTWLPFMIIHASYAGDAQNCRHLQRSSGPPCKCKFRCAISLCLYRQWRPHKHGSSIHHSQVYALLSLGVAVAAMGSWAAIALGATSLLSGCVRGISNLSFSNKWFRSSIVTSTPLLHTCSIGLIGTFVLLFVLMTQSDRTASPARTGLFLAFSASYGLVLSGLVNDILYVDPSILITALLGTVCTFAAFSVGSLVSKRRSLLYLGGLLGSALSWLAMAVLVNIFLRWEAIYLLNLYGGLLMLIGFVVYDTQIIIERSSGGDMDAIGHAVTLFVDFVGIFVRLAVILLRNSEKRRTSKNERR